MESKVAILIDGGFFVQRFKANQKLKNPGHIPIAPVKRDVETIVSIIMTQLQVSAAPGCSNHLFRTFYYDSMPFGKIIMSLNGQQPIDFSKSPVYASQTRYIDSLKTIEQFALRLGELSFSGWKLDPHKPTAPAKPDFRQKGVDMKIGLDIAWIAGRKTVDKIVLVTGDSDFISPMKLARREGLLVYLYPMGQTSLKAGLKEHADFIL